MTQLFADNAGGLLAAALTASATSLTLATGQGARFPSPTGGDFFDLTLVERANGLEVAWEVVTVSARAGDVLTIARGAGARAWPIDTAVQLRWNTAAIDRIRQTLAGKQEALGFTPVRQGGGTGQGPGVISIGWTVSGQTPPNRLRLQVDATSFADVWPISIDGTANTATNAADRPAGDNGSAIANTKHVYAATKAIGLGAESPNMGAARMDGLGLGTAVSVTGTEAEAAALDWPPAPQTGVQFWNVITVGSSTRTTQIASFSYAGGNSVTHFRWKYGASWGAWKRVVFTDAAAFTVTPTAPTAASGTNNTLLATTAHVFAATKAYGIGLPINNTVIANNADWSRVAGYTGFLNVATAKANGATVPIIHGTKANPAYGSWNVIGRRDTENGYMGLFASHDTNRLWLGRAMRTTDAPVFTQIAMREDVDAVVGDVTELVTTARTAVGAINELAARAASNSQLADQFFFAGF